MQACVSIFLRLNYALDLNVKYQITKRIPWLVTCFCDFHALIGVYSLTLTISTIAVLHNQLSNFTSMLFIININVLICPPALRCVCQPVVTKTGLVRTAMCSVSPQTIMKTGIMTVTR